ALRAALLAELRDRPWLPTLGGDERPARALALPGLTEPLADLLREVIPGLVAPALADRTAALTAAGATVIGPARLVELLAGSDRPAHWWRALYAALEPLLAEPRGAEELGALPVPLTDGRLVTGPRTVVLADLERQAQAGQDVPVHWARVVHPEAAHPLLGRLGARTVTAADLLSDPALRAELEDGEQADDLADTVLRLAGQVGPAGRLPAWLGALELPDAAGGTTPADELLLPDAPLAHVLVADSPFGVVADDVVREYGAAALRSVGVGATFGLLTEPDPTGPDHDLDDEETWWDELAEDPVVLTAVRDLDLVAADRWSQTLAMLAEDPALAAALSDRHGYTAWWLRRHARIGGVPLGALRSPDDDTFAGLLDPLEHPAASMLRAVLADPADLDRVAAEALLAALGDPQRHPTPAAVVDAHRLLAGANIVCDNVALPSMVRAASGATVEPRQALVLDQPWYVCAISPDRLVVGDLATAPELAELLDLPLASQAVSAEVVSVGRLTTWEREPGAVLIRTVVELPCARGDLVMHETLEIRLGGAVTGTMAVPWWVVGTTTHLAGSAILSR
ncbi:MAG: ATP-binding protein, partial [Mycobacteriaceae bacterium]|nr:ATP-binding protein [Mycobacteriaceae bacterium]